MTILVWIAALYICAFISISESGIQLLYGRSHTIYCGESDPSTEPGDWYHNETSLDVHNRSYTITNATFDDDGVYQCRRNGRNVLPLPLQVDVYGLLHITPVNCTSRFDGICVKNIEIGQSVTLCISRTTTPSVIPQGKRVTAEFQSEWSRIFIDTDGSLMRRDDPFDIYNDSCYTINVLQGDAGVFFSANLHPDDDITVQRNEVLQYPFNAFLSYENHHDIAIIYYVATEGKRLFYGRTLTLFCGDSDPDTPPGEWLLNGEPLGMNSRSYTIANATFDDDGEYQCMRNGSSVFSPPLLVNVYGLSDINPLNCTSVSNGVCVKIVERRQPVTLCTSYTTIPSTIPPGKRVIDVYKSEWLIRERGNTSEKSDFLLPYQNQITSDFETLYVCLNGSCQWSDSSDENYTSYLNVSSNCLTINHVQNSEYYRLKVVFYNQRDVITLPPIHVDFYLTHNIEIQVPYGGTLMLYCGELLNQTTAPGTWYHDSKPINVYSKTYTITNATYDDDGMYQCMRNGSAVFSSPLKVDVYGLLNITALNCTSKLNDGTCVIDAQRGQPVTFCISQFTTPSTIPQGKHAISVNESYWSIGSIPIYRCNNEYCEEKLNKSLPIYNYFIDVSDSCLTSSIEEANMNLIFLLYETQFIVNYNNIGAIQLPPRVEKFYAAYYKEIRIGYGKTRTIYCGNSNHDTPPGDWLHDGRPLGVYRSSYTIIDATFDDDGEYQCRRNGSNVFPSPLEVEVYGSVLNSSPLNCNNMSLGACARYVERGQPVTLCTTITTTPAVIPPGKHVVSIHEARWYTYVTLANGTSLYIDCLYVCLNGSCQPCSNSERVNYTHYSDVNDSCLTINNVLEKEMSHSFSLTQSVATEDRILQDANANYFFITFIVTELIKPTHTAPSPATPTGTLTASPTAKLTPIPPLDVSIAIVVSTSIIAIVIVVVIISLAIAISNIVKRYKHSKCAITFLSSEVDGPLRDSYSSRPINLTVYCAKDVKRLEKIGRGSFWKVYRGKLLDNRCAIKRLRGIKKSTNREGLIQNVLKELDMWSSLNHPNIVRLYGIYHEDDDDIGIPSLIVELMDRNLTDQLNATSNPNNRNALFPLRTKISILIQVAGALEYLHTHKNVVHGDLTANNVLLKESPTGSFTAKLSDFGMSRVLNEQDNIMSTAQGTYSYMPPEVHNAGQASTKVDIYSFGVMCVHVLCHKFPKPLYALTVDPTGTHIVVSEFKRYRPYLLELTDDEMLLEPLIEECLQYEPEDRLRPDEVIGQLNSIQGRLRLKEKGPAKDTQPSTVVHQHFIGPVVSGCTITESNLNVTSIADSHMQVSTEAEITPLTGPFEPVPAITSGADHPDTHHPCTAQLEDISEVSDVEFPLI